MAQAKGRKGHILLDFENGYGTDPVAAAAIKMPIISESLRAARTKQTRAVIRDNVNPQKPFKGRMDVSGNLVVPVDALAFPYWLKAMFGAPSSADNGDGTYTHTFKLGVNDQPSILLEKGATDLSLFYKYNGIMISRFSMTQGTDGELQATLEVMGQTYAEDGASYDATPTDPGFSPFEQYHANIQEAAADLDCASEFSLDWNFSLDGNSFAINNGGVRRNLPDGVAAVGGTLKALFESDALLVKARADTETSFNLTFTNGDEVLAIDLPEAELEDTQPPIAGPQGLVLDMNYLAFYDDNADSTAIKVAVTNATASYA